MKFNNFVNNNKIITIKNKFKTVTISVQLQLTYETFCIATIKNTNLIKISPFISLSVCFCRSFHERQKQTESAQ